MSKYPYNPTDPDTPAKDTSATPLARAFIIGIILIIVNIVGSRAFSQDLVCPDGTTTCNIATVGDREYNADQTIGDTVNPTYSPDSASSNSNLSNDIDNIIQGDTLHNNSNSTAYGNRLDNNNNNASNASADNNLQAKLAAKAAQKQAMKQAQKQAQRQAQRQALNNQNTNQNTNRLDNSARATGGQGGYANGGNASSDNAQANQQVTNVDASTRVDAPDIPVATAATIMLPPVNNTLCDGKGSAGVAIQLHNMGFNLQGKGGDRFCQFVLAGTLRDNGQVHAAQAAAAYLAQTETKSRNATINLGWVIPNPEHQ